MEHDLLPESGWRQTARHGMKFYTVGAIGIGVQLATLSLLTGFFKINYLIATFLAVEAAVLHNFLWHRIWTWADRPGSPFSMLLRFHLTNGAFSVIGTVFAMRVLVGGQLLDPALANLASVAFCSLVSLLNFFASDRFVFSGARRSMKPRAAR